MRPVVLSPRGPMLEPGAEPLGRFIDRIWQGETEWCVRHGAAIVQWRLGRPTYVWNANMPDEARVNIHWRMASDTFRLDVGSTLVHGRIDVSPEDVTFTPGDVPAPQLRDEHKSLFDGLRADEAFMRELSVVSIASALYWVLENCDVIDADGVRFEFGQRSAANLVAALRGGGEDYLDYAFGQGPEYTAADVECVERHFARLNLAVDRSGPA